MSMPRLWIGGRWIETGAVLEVVNPVSGEPLARVPLGNEQTLEDALAAATRAFPMVRAQPAHARAMVLQAVARGLEQRRQEFIDTIVAEAGKPVTFAEAEVGRAIMTFTAAAEETRRQQGELLDLDGFPSGTGHFGVMRRFPLGVIYGITPFNFPLNLVAHKVAPCLATGNTMIVKPAPKTPLTALLLAEVLEQAGVTPGQINIVTCPNDLAGRLVGDARVKMVSFTGSPTVGWPLKERCGRQRITLELGGNAGVIVHEDADLDSAIPAIATGGFGYAGQSCISVQRVFVHAAVYETFRERLLDQVRTRVRVGDPRERDTVVGPMIDAGAAQRVVRWINEAVKTGARLLTGGQARGNLVEPAVLENVAPQADLWAKEVFGPVVALRSYQDFKEALAQVNDSEFGLQAGVYTRDIARAWAAFSALDLGTVLLNDVPTFRVENMPYGGIKASGFGREGIRYAMEEMTEIKSLILKL
ncbi:MAG TPA: aldehyde dehydrogenase family protein [Candidatus Dormibacteraeota bacterium]|nr:aldehyde dehydrogenase family protein [Candidatus Dormibacteraeota bacterium]